MTKQTQNRGPFTLAYVYISQALIMPAVLFKKSKKQTQYPHLIVRQLPDSTSKNSFVWGA